MSAFSGTGLLGELEQLVLLATRQLGHRAYAVSIRDAIAARTGLELSRSSVYVTLDRLDRKGYVRSWFGDPTPERGGKAKRYFRVTASGDRALAAAARAVSLMRAPRRAPVER